MIIVAGVIVLPDGDDNIFERRFDTEVVPRIGDTVDLKIDDAKWPVADVVGEVRNVTWRMDEDAVHVWLGEAWLGEHNLTHEETLKLRVNGWRVGV